MDSKRLFIVKDNIYNKYGSLVAAKGGKFILDDTAIERLNRMGVDLSLIAEYKEDDIKKIDPKEEKILVDVGHDLFKKNSILERMKLKDIVLKDAVTFVYKIISDIHSSTMSEQLKSFYKIAPWFYIHCVNVAILSTYIGLKLNLEEDRLTNIATGALIHDIGVILIPKGIIATPTGSLSSSDNELIRRHCQIGYSLIQQCQIPSIVKKIVLQHHECLDGSGYPHNLRADNISIESKIVSFADEFDFDTYLNIDKNPLFTLKKLLISRNKYTLEYTAILLEQFL